MLILGIDDAGRGPVIGPMVLAGVLIEEEENEDLKTIGAKDSKLLLAGKRKEIGDKIKAKYKYYTEVVYPKEIDASDNLNYTEAIHAAMIINKLTENLNEPVEIILDCPSVNLIAWNGDVLKLLHKPDIVKMRCEHKADFNHPVVSAASIVAKEKREEEVARIKREKGIDFGSGYPSDPVTKEFIAANFEKEEYKDIIRFSWSTVKKLKSDKGQKTLF
jgi:ribonuclease HII